MDGNPQDALILLSRGLGVVADKIDSDLVASTLRGM
jgi:hypothetical protein